MQEGWHHELESPEGEMIYKGVVLNEMKGVFSSPESIIDRQLSHSLFPKTAYGYESGGDPVFIPDLTYDEFKEFHRKYYHPSNSRIFLYGDGNTEEYLKFLHKEYLNEFDRMEVDSQVGLQRRFSKPKVKGPGLMRKLERGISMNISTRSYTIPITTSNIMALVEIPFKPNTRSKIVGP